MAGGRGRRGGTERGVSTVRVLASGPLDASGVTLDSQDGDVAKQWYAAPASTPLGHTPPKKFPTKFPDFGKVMPYRPGKVLR